MSQADEKVLNAFLYDQRIKKAKPKMKSSINQMTTTATTFPKFMELPYELRDIVWTMAATALPARTIELRTIKIQNPGKMEYISQHLYPLQKPSTSVVKFLEVPRYTLTFVSPTPPPSLLSVSQHSRLVAKRHYTFAFRPIASAFLDEKARIERPSGLLLDRTDMKCPNCRCCTHGIWTDFGKDVFVAGKGVWANGEVQEEWLEGLEKDLYDVDVFHESRLSIHKIQILALPIRSLWTRNTVIWHLGFLPGLKEIWLVRTRGFDKKAGMELHGREVKLDSRPPDGKDEAVYAARTRGFRVLGYFMRIREAKALAEMLFVTQRLTVQDPAWEGPENITIWTATAKKKEENSKMKKKARKVWETVSGRRFKEWMGKNYIPPNFG